MAWNPHSKPLFAHLAILCDNTFPIISMGYTINVYNNSGKEIDFLAQSGNKKYFIQVALSVAEDKAYTREFDAFRGIDNLSQKILITNDDLDYSTSVVRHIKLKDFLMMNTLDA